MRGLRRALAVFGWIVATLMVFAASAIYHAQLPIARRIVRDAVNNYVSSQIRGELAIGRLDSVTLDHVVARWVALYDAQGRRVIVADRVDLYPEFGALRGNMLRFKVSRLAHGMMRLVEDESGVPTWISALSPRDTGPPSLNPLHALLDQIDVSDLTVYGSYLGLENFRVEGVAARGKLDIHHEVRVRIDNASGTFVQPFEFAGLIDDARGAIDTDPTRGLDLTVFGRRERLLVGAAAPRKSTSPDDERVRAHIEYKRAAPNLPQELRISVDSDEVSPETLRALGYSWIGPVQTPLRGHVELYGPPGELAIEADVDSAAGAARASGTISEAHGVSVHIMSDALELETLVSRAPAMKLSGSLHIAAPNSEEAPHVHVAVASTRYKGLSIPAIELDGRIEEDRVVIERARSSQGGRLAVSGTVRFDGATDLRIDANLPAVHREPNLARYVEDLEAQLQAAVRLRIPADGKSIDIDGQIDLIDVRYTSIAASRVTISGVARGDPELPQVDVEVRGENLRVLDYSLGVAVFTLRGGPHEYHAQGEFSPNREQKTFYFDADIAATKREFTIQADPIEFVFGDKVFRGAARDLTIVNGVSVSLGSLRLASGAERLEASGVLRVRGEDTLRADLQAFDLGALHALLGDRFPFKQGNADATVELRGDVARPQLLVQGAMRGGHVLDVPGVDAMYFVTYEDGALELDTQVEVAGHGSLHLGGHGRLNPDIADPLAALEAGHYDLELASTDFDLLLIPALRGVLHQSRVTGTAKITGSLAAPKLQGKGNIADFCTTRTRPVDVAGEFDYDGALATTSVQIEDAGGALADFTGHARVAWADVRADPNRVATELASGRWQLQGNTQPRALDKLPFDVPLTLQWPLALGSQFELQHEPGHSRGTIRFGARGTDQLTDETCKLRANTQSNLELLLEGERISATFDMSLAGERVFDGSGSLALELEGWLEGKAPLRITRADVKAHAHFTDIERVPVLCRHGRGDLHADLRFDSLFTPEQRAQIDLVGSLNPHVRVLEGRQRRVVESCRDDPARVWMQAKLDAKQIDVKGWLEGCYGGHTDLVAGVPLAWSGPGTLPGIDDQRDTRVQLDFGESQLRPLLDRAPGVLGFGATANGRLVAVGNNKRVSYTGQVGITAGKLYLLSTGQELSALEATLVGNGNWIKVDGLRTKTGSGSLEAAGGVGFDRWKPARVQLGLILKTFPVQREGLDMASLNGSAALSTEIGADVAQTAVKIHTLAIKMPSTSSRSLQSLEPHPDVLVTTDKPKEALEKPYAFDFFIDGQRGLTATRNDFDVGLAAELALHYADPELRVGGYVEFRRGTFEVFGKQFEVNRGSLQFDGGPELNPEVNLIATQRPEGGEAGGSDRVVARVSGTLAEPIVEFYSETCPGQGAVVMLVSGRCPTEADNSLQDASGTQNAFAAGIVGGILTLGARRELGGLIPRISVESTGQGSHTRVKAGFEAVPKFMRSLVQRVYLQGALSTRDDSQAEGSGTDSGATPDFLIELYFPHNIVGTGRVAPTSQSWGLDVTWEP